MFSYWHRHMGCNLSTFQSLMESFEIEAADLEKWSELDIDTMTVVACFLESNNYLYRWEAKEGIVDNNGIKKRIASIK